MRVIEAEIDRLSEGARLLIWGVRHWMVALLCNERVPASVTKEFAATGEGGFGAIVAMMLLAARDADRPLRVFPPCCAELSEDEQRLASAFDCARQGSLAAAQDQLSRLIGRRPSCALLEHVCDVSRHLVASPKGDPMAALAR